MPDIERHFWRKHQDQGLAVVALDAHDELEQMDQVRAFIDKLDLSYDVGLERSGTYKALAENFQGANPFPVDVIVDENGVIAYVAREYDPLVMTEVIENLLRE